MSPASPTISLSSFTSAVQSLLAAAEGIAQQLHLDFVESEHLLAAMLDSPDPGVQAALRNARIDTAELKGYLMNYLEPSAVPGQTTPAFSVQVKQVVTYAVEEAQRALLPQAGPMQLLLGLVRVGDGRAAHALARFQVTQASLAQFSAPEPTPAALQTQAASPTSQAAPVAAPSAPTPAAPASAPAAPATPVAAAPDAATPPGADAPAAAATPAAPVAPGASSTITAPVAASGVLANFTTAATSVLSAAAKITHDRKLTILEPEFVLLAFAQGADPIMSSLFQKLNVDVAGLAGGLDAVLERGTREVASLAPAFSPRMRRVLEGADAEAKGLGSVGVDPIHLLLALLRLPDGAAAEALKKTPLTYEVVRTAAPSYVRPAGSVPGLTSDDASGSSMLSKYGEDLTQRAREGKLDAVIGRQHEIEQCVSILSRRLKNNPIILGEAGVGKTALVEGLAQLIAGPGCPDILKGKRLISINMTSIISGASHRGEFEERMESLIKEVKESNGEIILFIDEIHTILGTGGGGDGSVSAANILKPALSRGEIRLIGATTTTEFKKSLEKDPALQRRFQRVQLDPPSVEVTVQLLTGLRPKYEGYHHVQIPDKSIESAALLSDRYIHERFLPDKAVDLIDQAAADKHLPALSIPQDITDQEAKVKRLEEEITTLKNLGADTRAKKKQRELDEAKRRIADLQQQLQEREGSSKSAIVTEEDIMRVISTMTGIPVSHLRESEAEKLLHMEERIHERVIGQEPAIHAISEAVRRGKAGLKNKNQPIGSFIFLGPTGVGKTELAKTVAEFLFGSEQALIRFDMSEFQEKHAVARLIGAPPGYVGYDEGGQLTEAVRARPYSVVLFDELEKAHSDIFDILLQLLDDGRLTDSQGRTVDFKNTIVICTSNIGARDIQEKLGALAAPDSLSSTPEADAEPQKATITQLLLSYKEAFGAAQTVTRTADEALALAQDLKQRAAAPGADLTLLVRQYSDDQRATTGTENEGRDGVFADAAFAEKDASKNAFPREVCAAIAAATPGELVGPVQSVLGYHLLRVEKKEAPAAVAAVEPQAASPKPQGATAAPVATDAAKPTDAAPVAITTPVAVVPEVVDPFPEPSLPKLAPLPAGMKGGIITPQAAAELQKPAGEVVVASQMADVSSQLAAVPTPAAPAAAPNVSPFPEDGAASAQPAGAPAAGAPKQDDAAKPADAPKPADAAKPADAPKPTDKVEEKLSPEEENRKQVLGELKKVVMTDLQKFMRPEMVNRFDEVVIFEPLTLKQISGIVSLIIAATQERLAEQSIFLEVEEPVKEYLAKRGFDPMFGARPLKRTCQRELDNVLSSLLIGGTFKTHDVIQAVLEGEQVVFRKKEVPAAAELHAASSTETKPAEPQAASPTEPKAAEPQATPAAAPAAPEAVAVAAVPAPATPQSPAPAAGGLTFDAPAAQPQAAPAPVASPTFTADQNAVFSSELPPGAAKPQAEELVPAFPSENPPVVNAFQE